MYEIIKKKITPFLICGIIIGLINTVGITLFIDGDIFGGVLLLFCSFLLFIYVLLRFSLSVVTYFFRKAEKGISER